MEVTAGCKLNKELLRKMAQETTDIKLRYGIDDLFNLIYKFKIKTYIVSGGLYDIIDAILTEAIPIYPKLKEEKLLTIIGNRLIYDEEGNSKSFKKPILHTFNKSEVCYYLLNLLDF